jgi:Tol biopolymer transport system component
MISGIKTSMSQGTQVTFGQNRVQFHDFDWVSYTSDHFVTYYYPGGQELAKFVVIAAEDRIKKLEEQLNFVLNSKIEILIYNDITDLSQTNIGISEQIYNVGGTNFTDGAKLFLYYDGNHDHMLHFLEKELAKIYLNNMMSGKNFAEVIQNAVFLNLPNWFISGLAAYIGEDWNVEKDDQLRKFWNESSKPSFAKLAQTNPEFAGQALWYFIFEKYGNSSLKNILYLTRINRSVNKGFVFSLGKSSDDIIQEWEEYFKFHSKADLINREIAKKEDLVKAKIRKNQSVSQVKISPDGKNLAYALHKKGSYKVFSQNLETKKRKKIFKGGFNSDNFPYDLSYPLLTWNPSSTKLIGIHEKKDQIKMVDYDLIDKKKKKDDVRGFQRIYQINFTSDGKSLIFSAQNKGQTDIYTFQLSTTRPTQLTNDIFDDSYPTMLNLSGANGILFSSNRPDANTIAASYDSILPVGKLNLYFLNLDNPSIGLVKIASDKTENQTQSAQINEQYFSFLSDENGIINLYRGQLDSSLLRIDTIQEENTLRLDTIYTFTSTIEPLTDMSTNILEASIAQKSNKWTYLLKGNKKQEIHVSTIPSNELPSKLTKTTFSNSLSALEKINSVQKRSERVTPQEINALKDLDSFIHKDFKFSFHSKFNYTFLTSSEKDSLKKLYIDSMRAIPGNEDYSEVNQENNQPINQFVSGRSIPYRAKFYSNFMTTQIDNSVLPFSYQSFSLNGAKFDYPNLSGMIMYGIQDLMEDHKLVGGFRLPSNLKGTEIFISYENLKKRLDKRLLFYRKSNQENYTLLVNNTFQIPALGKQKTNYAEVRLSYPFDVTKSLKFYTGFRNDRLILGYTDTITMIADIDKNENWTFMKLEFVHDNSREVQENIFNGFRYKFYTEYFKNWNEKKSNLFTVGWDVRHYTSIYKNLIWANRIAGATSFGQKKIIYYLGGVDTWLNNKYDDNTAISSTEDYAFQAQATNVRGFPINIRNGTSNIVLNSEIRWPIFSFLANKPIKSAFLKNFQFIGFFDIGSAYNGLTPFNEKNPYINQQVTPNGNQTPVVVEANYYRNPTVMGTGAGFRTTLLGYFLRVDLAWGIDGGLVNKKPMWLFSFSKDF